MADHDLPRQALERAQDQILRCRVAHQDARIRTGPVMCMIQEILRRRDQEARDKLAAPQRTSIRWRDQRHRYWLREQRRVLVIAGLVVVCLGCFSALVVLLL